VVVFSVQIQEKMGTDHGHDYVCAAGGADFSPASLDLSPSGCGSVVIDVDSGT
jgi:hypothetical protein